MNDKVTEPKSVLSLSHEEAKDFFLKHESYFNADLPPYFRFDQILSEVASELAEKPLNGLMADTKAKDCDGVNHVIISNKDGMLSWRPLELIHPVLYVNLVREMTREDKWQQLKDRFALLNDNVFIKCLSIPIVASSDTKDRAEQVSQWWQEVELQSVEYSLDYEYMFETDITDCYGSIYTHSIAWAVEGKEKFKKKENRNNTSLLGVFIDKSIQEMQHSQTNGIPQGSVLMDFIAEILLGYIDNELSQKINEHEISSYRILRYRDDYRIFVNNPEMGERILKLLSEVLTELGLRLNPNKTIFSDDVVNASVKDDKKSWLASKSYHKNLFKHCLIIKKHSDQFPNSGSLATALSKFYKRILKLKELDLSAKAIISTVIDIAYKNPRTYPVSFAIISKYISLMDDKEKLPLIMKIKKKFTKLPNVGYMEVWFQRSIKEKISEVELNEPLCRVVKGEKVVIWNSEWIGSKTLKKIVESVSVVDSNKLAEAEPVIDSLEFDLFPQGSG